MVKVLPNTSFLPVPKSAPAGHTTAAAHLLWQVFPRYPCLEYKNNSGQSCPVRYTWTASFGPGLMFWQKWFNLTPQFVAYQFPGHLLHPPLVFYCIFLYLSGFVRCSKLAINLAFSCSLRIGELLGLTWDCVDISEKSIQDGEAHVLINKELIRVSRDAMKELDGKGVIFAFPVAVENGTTQLVLKKPKTVSSTRKVFLPKTVAKMLVQWKIDQNQTKAALGDEYHDYDLVLARVYLRSRLICAKWRK